MQREQIISMLDTGNLPPNIGMDDLERLSAKYPYCSTFHLLLAAGAKQLEEIEAKVFIDRAAVYVQDRSKLYDFVIRDGLKLQLEEATEAEFEKKESPGDDLIVTVVSEVDPLEEQIMAEALTHLGEMEVNETLQTTPERDVYPERETQKETPKSFGDWLISIDRKSKENPDRAIIDKFISEDRKISPVKQAFFSPSRMGKMSLVEDESFVTETLAKIYERQGNYKKAATAYKNLSLKYPEKRVYFAALQKRAEENI